MKLWAISQHRLKNFLFYVNIIARNILFKTRKGVFSMGTYVCDICGYTYDGDLPFEELGDDYVCPICGVGKDQFTEE